MEKSSKEQTVYRVEQHNNHLPATVFGSNHQFLARHQSLFVSNLVIPGQFSFISKDLVLYYASCQLVIKSISNNTSTFLYKQNRLRTVSALSVASRQDHEGVLIAVGEIVDNKPLITIITLEGRRDEWRSFIAGPKGRIQHLEFSKDRTKLGCLLSQKDQVVLSVWNLAKGTVMVSHTFKGCDVKKFTLNINNDKSLYIYGDGVLKLFDFNANQKCLKELGVNLLSKQNREARFVDHTWLMHTQQPHSLVLVSSTRVYVVHNDSITKNILIDIEKTKIKSWHSLKLDNGRDPEDEKEVVQPDQIQVRLTQKVQLKCLMKESRLRKSNDLEIVVGASNGLVMFFEIGTCEFNTFQVFSNSSMVALNSNAGRTMISSVSQNYYNHSLSYNYIRLQLLDSQEVPSRGLFGQGCHFGSILAMSVANAREVMGTASADGSLRIWNYNTRESFIMGSYKQQMSCLSMHPSGLYLVVTFPYQIILYSLLSHNLYQLKSIKLADECKSVQFSHKGHFLISNQTVCLKIYDSNTLRVLSMFQLDDGRIAVSQYALSHDDLKLVVCFDDGQVYCWNLRQGSNTLPDKPAHIEPLLYTHMVVDNELFVGTNQLKYLVLYKDNCRTLLNQFGVTNSTVSSLLLSKELGVLFVGTSSGAIQLFPWPIGENICPYQIVEGSSNKVRLIMPIHYEIEIHDKCVLRLSITEDSKYLFAGMDDGGIMQLEIKGLRTEQQRSEKNKDVLLETKEHKRKIKQVATQIYLVCESKLRIKAQQLNCIEIEVGKLEEEVEKSRMEKQKGFQKSIAGRLEAHCTLTTKERQTNSRVLAMQARQILELQEEYKQTSKQAEDQLRDNISKYQERKAFQLGRKKVIQDSINQLKKVHGQRLDKLLHRHKLEIGDIKTRYRQVNASTQQTYSGLFKEAKEFPNARPLLVDLAGVEDLQDGEDVEIQLDSNRKNVVELGNTLDRLRQEQRLHQAEHQESKTYDQVQQTELGSLLSKYTGCRLQNIKSREQIVKIEHQLNERVKIISNKETAFKDASEYQTNLQNYKAVIDQRLSELQLKKQQILDVIGGKESQLQALFNQLISSTGTNDTKNFQIIKADSVLANLSNSLRRSKIQIFFGLKRLGRYQRFLEQLLDSECSKKDMYVQISNLLSRPLGQDVQMIGYLNKETFTDQDMVEVFKLRQEKGNQENDQLEREGKVVAKKFNLMKFTCKKMKDIHETNIVCTLKQNRKLIQECNLLRYEDECYSKEIARMERFINSTLQEQKFLASKKKSQDKLSGFQRKLNDNQESLRLQTSKLDQIRQFISTIKERDRDNQDSP